MFPSGLRRVGADGVASLPSLEYIDPWSLGLDFEILLRTIPVVVLGVGAR